MLFVFIECRILTCDLSGQYCTMFWSDVQRPVLWFQTTINPFGRWHQHKMLARGLKVEFGKTRKGETSQHPLLPLQHTASVRFSSVSQVHGMLVGWPKKPNRYTPCRSDTRHQCYLSRIDNMDIHGLPKTHTVHVIQVMTSLILFLHRVGPHMVRKLSWMRTKLSLRSFRRLNEGDLRPLGLPAQFRRVQHVKHGWIWEVTMIRLRRLLSGLKHVGIPSSRPVNQIPAKKWTQERRMRGLEILWRFGP